MRAEGEDTAAWSDAACGEAAGRHLAAYLVRLKRTSRKLSSDGVSYYAPRARS